MEEMEIKIRTLTPIWTGGVDQAPDRLHETGLIGSLRWWYEALVRRLGGYACDPTEDNPEARCRFDAKAYEHAKQECVSQAEALQVGLKTICPVCYLFGATGWARLFQLRAMDVPTTPLHFRTSLSMNKGWLKRVFGSESQTIDGLKIPYGDLGLQTVLRGHNEDYVKSQLALLFRFAMEYGGLGARLQHGFGQIELAQPVEMLDARTIADGITRLTETIRSGYLRSDGPVTDTPFDLHNFVSMSWSIPSQKLAIFTKGKAHIGSRQKSQEKRYLPCAFDLRYKGSNNLGIRRWLETTKQWKPNQINLLMGVSEKKRQKLQDEDRLASRLCFGMPYRRDSDYRLRVFGFAPSPLTPEELRDLCSEYIHQIFTLGPTGVTLGRDLIASIQGE